MKNGLVRVLPLFAIVAILAVSCKKKDNTPVDQKTPFVFSGITASDTAIAVGAFTTLTANATGDELTYTWSSESGYGTFVGSGHSVSWSVCHSDFFNLTCNVQDKYGAALSKTIRIHAKP